MVNLLALFGTAFLLNVTPAFAPPTWMVVSWAGFSRLEADPVILAGIAVCTAMVGRLMLTRLSRSLVCNRWMREADRQNIDVVCAWPEDRKGMTAGLMLAYAFSPFSSSYIFIVHGLAGMRLWLIGLLLFIDHWVSCLIWTHIAQISAYYLDEETEIDGAYMDVYFIVSQVVSLALVYGFIKLDWQRLSQTKHLRWRRRESIASPTRDTRTKVERWVGYIGNKPETYCRYAGPVEIASTAVEVRQRLVGKYK